jgi:hypothetical protein
MAKMEVGGVHCYVIRFGNGDEDYIAHGVRIC